MSVVNPSALEVGDKLLLPSKPHMRYTVNAVDDLHIEIRDQLWVGVIYTHKQFREHMAGAVLVDEHTPGGWFA